MRVALDTPETAASLREEVNKLKREQEKLEVFLRETETERVKGDARDFYFQTDDLKYHEKDDEWREHYSRLEVSCFSFEAALVLLSVRQMRRWLFVYGFPSFP